MPLTKKTKETRVKKIALMASCLAVAGVSQAETGLQISGTVDTAVQYLSGSGQNRTALASGGNATSKLIIRGTEDLGAGLQSFFWLESGMGADTGTFSVANVKNQPHLSSTSAGGMSFDRKAILGLRSEYGTLQMGRDWTPTYETFVGKYDPFGVSIGIGINYSGSRNADGVRASNSIAYVSPVFAGGLNVKLQHWFGEGGSDQLGTGSGLRVNYDRGGLSAAAAFTTTQLAGANIIYRNIAAAYDFGQGTAISMSVTRDSYAQLRWDGWLVGARHRVGAHEIKGALSQIKINEAGNPKGHKLALGYVNHLSKRTALYGTLVHIKNRNGGTFDTASFKASPNRSITGFEFGLRHNF